MTGAAGFIGSHLAERLVDDGYDVVGIDCFLPNYSRERKQANLARLAGEPRFELVEDEMSAPSAARAMHGCDAVVHMAAVPGVRTADEDGLRRANVTGTERLIDLLEDANVPRVILASSSSIYGPSDRPASEDDAPAPGSFYGRTKLAAEVICRRSRLDAVILRYFTVYGARQRPDMAFAAFISAALDGGDARLIDAGRHVRHFTHVSDVIEATMRALHGPRAGVYNVAGPKPATVADSLRLVEEILGRPVPARPQRAHAGEAQSTNANLSRAKHELGWEPIVELSEGLRLQIDDALNERCRPLSRVAASDSIARVSPRA